MLHNFWKPEFKMIPDWQEVSGFIYCLPVFLVPVSFLFLRNGVFCFWKLRAWKSWVAWTPRSQASVVGQVHHENYAHQKAKSKFTTALKVCISFWRWFEVMRVCFDSRVAARQKCADAQKNDESFESPLLYFIYLSRLLSNKWEHQCALLLYSLILELSCLHLPLFILISILPAPSALLLFISGSAANTISALSYFPDSLPLVTFQYGWINLRSPHPSFTSLPSIMLPSCPLPLVLWIPPHLPPHPMLSISSLLSSSSISTHLFFLFYIWPSIHPSPALGSWVSTSALNCPLAAESAFTFAITCDIVCTCVCFLSRTRCSFLRGGKMIRL